MTQACPQCGQPVDWSLKPRWRPFCSERCRMIDLGAWISEEHAIPGEPADPAASEDHRQGDDEH